MKKHILTIALLSTLGSYAQNLQNANWCFGFDYGLNFNTTPPTEFMPNIYSNEGCASLSDNNGNLILYTDGIYVFSGDGMVMLNGTGLRGGLSSTQSATVIHKPGSTNVYIFTIDGVSGVREGLHYSEVDFSGGGSIANNQKNIPLLDENNVEITTNYLNSGNMSEKGTSITHCNGTDYWFVTQIADKIYSYRITSAGVAVAPESVSQAPVNLQLLSTAGIGQMKISRDGTRIAVAYNSLSNSSNPESAPAGIIHMGDFDSNTGEVVFNTVIQVNAPGNPDHYYGLDFSPDSDRLYFGAKNLIYQCDAKNITNPAPSVVIASQTDGSPIANRYGLQTAVDGKIYVVNADNVDTTIRNISVINDPNNSGNPNLHEKAITATTGAMGLSLPQWVYSQATNCPDSYTLTSPDTHTQPFKYKTSNFIITNTNYSVAANQNIHMTAVNYIQMDPNTTINSDSVFLAEIASCSTCTSSSASTTSRVLQNTPEADQYSKGLLLYPNPSNDYVNLNAGKDVITDLTVTSLEGQIIFRASGNATSDYTLDVSSYTRGIYIISVATKNGDSYMKKIAVK